MKTLPNKNLASIFLKAVPRFQIQKDHITIMVYSTVADYRKVFTSDLKCKLLKQKHQTRKTFIIFNLFNYLIASGVLSRAHRIFRGEFCPLTPSLCVLLVIFTI